MTLTSDQLAYWEDFPQDMPLYMYIHSPATVFAAQVNQTSFTYPIQQVTFDNVTTGSYIDVREGMTVLFGTAAGLDDLGRVPAKRAAGGDVTGTTYLNFMRVSQGVGDGEVSLSNNVYITVLDQYLIWSVAPYITDTGVIYKDGDRGFNQSVQQRPKPNIGGDVLKIIEFDETEATIPFDGSLSELWNPDASSVITWTWDFADGTPSSSSVATPGDVTFPIGKRHISLTIVDNQGGFRTTNALIVVAQRDDPDLIKVWDVESWTERIDGQDLRIRVHQPLSYADYPDGTDVLICTTENVDQVGLAGREHMLFSGWLHDETNRVEATQRGLISRLTFQLLDAAGRLRLSHQFPETVERKAAAGSWAEMEALNLDRLAHYSIDWHSTAFSRVDYFGADQLDVYAVRGLELGGDNLYEGVNFIAGAMGYAFTCNINNQLKLIQDPQLAPTAAQNSQLSVGFSRNTSSTLTLQPKHWNNYEYTYKRMPRVHFNWGETLLTSAADMESTSEIPTAFVVAPGFAPGQGTSENNTTRQVSRNVAEIRTRVGNFYRARQNALTENFQFQLNPMRHAIHPANMEWFTATISSGQAGYRGRTISAAKFLPIEISYQTDVAKRIRRASVAVEREVTNATPAVQYTPTATDGDNWSVNLPDITIGDWIYNPPPSTGNNIPEWTNELPISGIIISASEAKAALMVSFDPNTSTVTYADISSGLSTPGIWFRSDPFNYKRGYGLFEDGLYVYADQSDSGGSWTLVANNATLFGNSSRKGYKLLMSHLRRGWMMALCGASGAAVSFDYGATWTQVALNGGTPSWSTSVGRTSGDAEICGHDANHIYSSVQHPSVLHQKIIYYSTDGGLTWTARGGSNPSDGGGAAAGYACLGIPYNRLDGSPNVDDANMEMAWVGWSTGNQARMYRTDDRGASWDGIASESGDNKPYPSLTGNPLHFFTHDSSYFTHVRRLNSLGNSSPYYATDGLAGASILTQGNGTALGVCVGGWSMNPEVVLGFARAYRYSFTLDGGLTTIAPNMPSGWADGVAYVEFSLYPFQ